MAIGTPVTLGSFANGSGALTSLQLTCSANILAGDCVVVAIGAFNANPTITNVSDGTNTYTKAVDLFASTSYVSIWYKLNASAVSSPIITATQSSTGYGTIAALRVTGIATSSALDKTATNSAGSGTGTVVTGTLSQANELVVGAWNANVTGYLGEINSFTSYGRATNTTAIDIAALVVASTSTVSYGPSWTASGSWANAVATFNGAAAGLPFKSALINQTVKRASFF